VNFGNIELPPQLQLMSLERSDNTILLRIRHIYERSAPAFLSRNVMIDVTNIFTGLPIQDISQTTLNGIQNFPPQRRIWPYKDFALKRSGQIMGNDSLIITLGPLEIATFLITLGQNKNFIELQNK